MSRYLARIRPEPTKPRSQTWTTFLNNHARDIVAADMFVVPTIRFQILYVFIILGPERRRLFFANVTAHPTAEWLAQQVVNAFPWDTAPKHPRPRPSLRARLLGASQGPRHPRSPHRRPGAADQCFRGAGMELVELMGIEPMTS